MPCFFAKLHTAAARFIAKRASDFRMDGPWVWPTHCKDLLPLLALKILIREFFMAVESTEEPGLKPVILAVFLTTGAASRETSLNNNSVSSLRNHRHALGDWLWAVASSERNINQSACDQNNETATHYCLSNANHFGTPANQW